MTNKFSSNVLLILFEQEPPSSKHSRLSTVIKTVAVLLNYSIHFFSIFQYKADPCFIFRLSHN